ncbi:hypothetical protein BBP40_008808 [Aspergillus hancockii]|nr:hypothetical protein BBP40_008808 [Aspergillus hancockii]
MAPIFATQQQLISASSAGRRTKQKPDGSEGIGRVPVHPISQLQGPFEESIIEATEGAESEWMVDLNAQSRRRDLLESPRYERLCGRKWLQRPGERYHPFWKLVSQISFGIHLLTNRLAKSDSEVLRILQGHVDELDGFLGRTTEDFLIIQVDVYTRTQYLSLPLQNLTVFDEMLQDRKFRLTMIDYNEKIEHAIERFSTAVEDTLKDMQKGREAIGALWQYLRLTAKDYGPLPSNLFDIYNAMLSNTEGWNTAFSKLRRKGVSLLSALSQLGLAITEMQRRVGVASRKEMAFLQTTTATSRGRSLRERLFEKRTSVIFFGSSNPEKPLPRDPFFSDITNFSPGIPLYTQTERHRITRKSAPNLRALHEPQNREGHTTIPGGVKYEATAPNDSSPPTLIPRIQRNLSKRLSKARPTNARPTSGDVDVGHPRPATAPCRTLRSRSVSLEQLKAFRKLKRDQQHQQQEATPVPQPRHPCTAQTSAKRETMLNQFLHYFKSDRVIDAWDNTTRKEKVVRHSTPGKKAEPCSKFRAISAAPDASGALQARLLGEDLDRSMAWLQEDSIQNTYSLKPKRDVAPRIHVLSVHTTLSEELEEECCIKNKHDGEITDTGLPSIITALPSVSPPLAAESSSMSDQVA